MPQRQKAKNLKKKPKKMKHKPIRRYFIAGLLLWIPIWVTLLVIKFMVDVLDGTMSLLPKAYQPDTLIGMHIPGLGVVISLLVVFFSGLIVTNFFGRWIVSLGEAILARIPLVRSIYNATKQVAETIFSSNSQSFRKVLLVQYPREGLWSIAFQTGHVGEKLNSKTDKDMVAIFIPTTPNPTSGFLMMIPREDAIELEMSIDEALKMVISLGVMQPKNSETEAAMPVEQ